MFKHMTRTRDFLLPVMMILFGGFIGTWSHERWWTTARLVWLVALLMTLWLVVCGIINEWRELVQEQNERITENIRWYETVHRLTEEEKIELGLTTVPDRVTLEINRTADAGFYVRDLKFLSVSPVKFKAVVQASFSGVPFSERAMSGPGKILTGPEFRKLKDELTEYGLIAPRSEKDERQGSFWTSDGQKVMQEAQDTMF